MRRIYSAYSVCAIILLVAPVFLASSFVRASAGRPSQQNITPAGQLSYIIIDGGNLECILGSPDSFRGIPGYGWANKLTPPSYPATLRSIAIGFNRGAVGLEVRQDDLYRVAVFADPGKTGPADNQIPAATFIARVRGVGQSLMTYNLDTPVTIQGGSFDIAVIDDYGVANHPAIFDIPGKSMPPGSDSFTTFDGGGKWSSLLDPTAFIPTQACTPASFVIRATVETGSADVLAATTKIKDPLAVEPWSVAASASQVIVTNYVSDNLPVIKTSDNSFQNIPVGDGPGGAADGPFGVVVDPAGSKAYVTLFGSNTIPSKEFPIDYSTVGAGRVLVLANQADGSLAPGVTISVAKGPRF